MKKSLRLKAGALVLVIALAIAVVAVRGSFVVYQSTIEEQFRISATNLAHTEAIAVDKKLLSTLTDAVVKIYREQVALHGGSIELDKLNEEEKEEYFSAFQYLEETNEYQVLYKLMEQIAEVNDIQSPYIAYMDEETQKGIYIIDASDENACRIGTCDHIEEKNLELMKQGIYDFPAFVTNYPEYGWLCTASAPIVDEQGKIIANANVDISMNEIIRRCVRFLNHLVWLLGIIIAIVSVGAIFLITKVIVLPINKLANVTENFVKEGYVSKDGEKTDLTIKSKDEIGILYQSVSKMQTDIQQYIQNLTAATAEKERIGTELHVAKHIQADMLPSIFPPFPDRKEFDIYASMDPAKEVGGDFYDFFLLDDDHLALVMADVSGKGVPAALFMVIAKTLLKNRAQMGGTPSEILADVNEKLCDGNKEGMFVTVWLAILELSTGKGIEANAGHEYPAIKRKDGKFELIKNHHSPVVAAMEGINFRQNEFRLYPGDRLFVYTDGLPEATNSENELFGTERMLDSLNKHKDATLHEILDGCTKNIEQFVGSASQFDDITMLCLDYYGNQRD